MELAHDKGYSFDCTYYTDLDWSSILSAIGKWRWRMMDMVGKVIIQVYISSYFNHSGLLLFHVLKHTQTHTPLANSDFNSFSSWSISVPVGEATTKVSLLICWRPSLAVAQSITRNFITIVNRRNTSLVSHRSIFYVLCFCFDWI